jgi:integrase
VVLEELARHVEEQRGVLGMGPGEGLAPGTLLFTRRGSQPWRRSSWGDAWRASVQRAGAPPGTGYHDLRHYYAALLIRRGASVKTVQNRLGHRSAVTTLDLYGWLWPDAEDQTHRDVDAELGGDFRGAGLFAGLGSKRGQEDAGQTG